MQRHDAKWAQRGGEREVSWRTLFGLNISRVREAGFLFWKELTSYLDKRTLTGDVLIPNVKTTPGEFACNYELSQYSRRPLLNGSRHFSLDIPWVAFKEQLPVLVHALNQRFKMVLLLTSKQHHQQASVGAVEKASKWARFRKFRELCVLYAKGWWCHVMIVSGATYEIQKISLKMALWLNSYLWCRNSWLNRHQIILPNTVCVFILYNMHITYN